MFEQKRETKEFYRRLRKLVLPIACQNLLYSAVGGADALMLGFVDQTSLSAVSLATQVSFVLSLFQGALMGGATILAAQYWGKGDTKAVEKVLAIAMRYSILISLVFAMAGLAYPELIMRFFTSDPALIKVGADYIKVVSISYLLSGISQIYLSIMKNCDRAVMSTVISAMAVVLNVILNSIFIFGLLGFPAMGAVGAALATDIAIGTQVISVIIILLRKTCIALRIQYIFRRTGSIHKDFIKYSLPVLGNQLAWGGGITMYSVIMGHLGNDATAANSVATIGRNMCASLCWGIGTGSGILVGQKLGRNDLEGAKRDGSRLCKIALVTGVASGLILLALTPIITYFVDLSDAANGYLKWMLIINSYYIIGNSINSTVIAGIFYAGGDSRFGLICDSINMWLIILPCGFLAAFVFKVPVLAVSFILSMDEFTKLPIVYRHYIKYKWIKNLTREKDAI